MSASIKNLYQFRTTSKITQAQGAASTFTVGNDIFTNSAVAITAWSIQLTNRTGSIVELFTVTVAAWTATIAARGIKPDWTTDTIYQYERPRNTLCTVTVLENQLSDKTAINTFTETQTFAKDIVFTGTTNPWIRPRGLTTTQMNALDMTGINSAIIYNTTANEHYQYIWGARSAVSSGSTQPNASETVAGKVEISTQAEFDAWTATGWTWASVVATNDQIRKQISTATAKATPINADSLAISDSAASGVIKRTTITEFKAAANLQATTTTSWFVELATDAEVATGTDQTRYINSLQLKSNTKSSAWTTTRTTADSTWSQTIAHWLLVAPRLIELKYMQDATITWNAIWFWTYDWTTNRAIGLFDNWATADYRISATLCLEYTNSSWAWRTASATVDATNITLSWTKWWAWLNLLVMWTAHA